ncbi:MAG: hypothetical protein RLZZ324_368 [Candidatus Parcubacteria bacterium]|jgi:hypothetical protein
MPTYNLEVRTCVDPKNCTSLEGCRSHPGPYASRTLGAVFAPDVQSAAQAFGGEWTSLAILYGAYPETFEAVTRFPFIPGKDTARIVFRSFFGHALQLPGQPAITKVDEAFLDDILRAGTREEVRHLEPRLHFSPTASFAIALAIADLLIPDEHKSIDLMQVHQLPQAKPVST